MISLWVATSYFIRNGKKWYMTLITALPATFMSAVSATYILVAKEGFKLPVSIGYPVGGAVAVILFTVYVVFLVRSKTVKKAEA